jgi:tetratricopeptide (TPR) repeat protein
MSAGELFDLIRPAIVIVSALISTWILASARRRFPFHQAMLWTGIALFLPMVVLPFYLIVLLFWRRPRIDHIRGRFTIPILYLSLILATFAVYEYRDSRSADSHIARASFAKVSSHPMTAIQEYRRALEVEDNPHTHKLLALSLMEMGFASEAIIEFRRAEAGGEPDDAIHYYLGDLLEKNDHRSESIIEYKKFVTSKTCLQIDNRCESARQQIEEARMRND